MSYLCMPYILFIEEEIIELTANEEQIVEDILEDFKNLKQLLAPYDKQIRKHFIYVEMTSFYEACYLFLLQEGEKFENWEDLLQGFLQLEEEWLKKAFIKWFGQFAEKVGQENIFDAIERWEGSEEKKWQFYSGFRKVKNLMREMVALYREITPICQPFLGKYEKEIEDLSNQLDLTTFYQDSPVDLQAIAEKIKKNNWHVFITSPLYMSNRIISFDDHPDTPLYFYIFPRSDLLLKNRGTFNLEMLELSLKALSDPMRYQILRKVIEGELQNKEIADQLGITSANVSFHIQKLFNAQLLKVSIENQSTKYQLNRTVLEQLITRLQKDFDLK